MKNIYIFILFISYLSSFSQTGTLIVNFDKIFETQGNLITYIFDSKIGFPSKKDYCKKIIIEPYHHQKQIEIPNLDFGTYALILVYDQNSNNKMDRNFLGLPAEKYALSGNSKFHFGPPVFDEVKFSFTKDLQHIYLKFD